MLSLSGLPEDKKKPRLRIDNVTTIAMTELEEEKRQHLKHCLGFYPRGMFVIPCIYEVNWKMRVSERDIILISLQKPGAFAFEVNPMLNPSMPTGSVLIAEMNAWKQVINDVAEGKRTDLFRSIKETIKRNKGNNT